MYIAGIFVCVCVMVVAFADAVAYDVRSGGRADSH